MREGIGTTFNLLLLFYFMLLVAAFALFGTNYYRAFNLKNKLISYTEAYEGNFNNSNFVDSRKDVINRTGYNIDTSKVKDAEADGWHCPSDEGWCYKLVKDTVISTAMNGPSAKSGIPKKDGYYLCTYYIKTFVSTDIPVLNKLFIRASFFEVNGTTKEIRRRVMCSE